MSNSGLVIIFLGLIGCASPSLVGSDGARQAGIEAKSRAPAAQKVLDYRIGYGSRFGTGKLSKVGERFLLKIRIAFFGIGEFARLTPQEVAQTSGIKNPPPGFFVKGATSFAQVPELQAKIKEIVSLIENQTHNTEFLQVKIEAVFPDEKTFLDRKSLKTSDRHDYSYALKEGMERYLDKDPDAVQVVVIANPNPYTLTPGYWDPYAEPLLSVHEFTHMLGVHSEGYSWLDYPANGIMNDENVFREMTRAGQRDKIRILESDLYEGLLYRRVLSKDIEDPQIKGRATESIYHQANDVSASNPAGSAAAAKLKVEQFLKSLK